MIPSLEKSIAFFDFDGTITRKDTMIELIKFSKGKSAYYRGLLLLSPFLLAMKLGIISNQKGKEKMLGYFFGGIAIEDFEQLCEAFTNSRIPGLIRPDAMAVIQKHFANNVVVVVVSASAENWVSPWCRQNNIEFICSKLSVVNKKLTGKMIGANCNGAEKVTRIKLLYNQDEYKNIYCYGDTNADKLMLQLSTEAYFRVFTQ